MIQKHNFYIKNKKNALSHTLSSQKHPKFNIHSLFIVLFTLFFLLIRITIFNYFRANLHIQKPKTVI